MKKKIILLMFFLSLLFSSIVLFTPAYAQCGGEQSINNYNVTSSNANCPPDLAQISGILVAVINIFFVLSGVVLFFMLLLHGFNFITSTGEPERIESSRKGIVFSLIGFAAVFLSFVILNIVVGVTGLAGSAITFDGHGVHFNILAPAEHVLH